MGSGPDTNDHDRRAETWFFEILVRLRQDQTFSDLLNARERDLDGCLASVSVISWACSPTEPETPGTMALEGFVHDGSSNQIRLTSLKRWLPEGKTTDAGIVIKTFFEEVNPGRGNNYRDCPKISKFLQETTLEPVEGKRLRVDCRGSSEVFWKDGNSLAKTWFWHGSMTCSDATQVDAILRSELVANRQASSLGRAMSESVNDTVISFACSRSGPAIDVAASQQRRRRHSHPRRRRPHGWTRRLLARPAEGRPRQHPAGGERNYF